jgi:hypothetical protein
MQFKPSTASHRNQMIGILALTIALILGSTTLARADRSNPTRSKIVKAYTDLIYYNKLYPEFGTRRLQSPDVAPGDASYWREWRAIYQAVDRDVTYGEINCGDGVSQDWRLADFDRQSSAESSSGSLDRIADVIVNQRRDRLGNQLTTDDWQQIRKTIEMTDRVACFLPIESNTKNDAKNNVITSPRPIAP